MKKTGKPGSAKSGKGLKCRSIFTNSRKNDVNEVLGMMNSMFGGMIQMESSIGRKIVLDN
jgi:hypothetical protein